MEKEILTIADASELLSLSEGEVEQLLSDGELPGRRVGNHWFLSRQRLLQFIAGDSPKSASPRPVAAESPKTLPPKVLAPNWRCESCQEVHPPELVECPRCGAARNTPLVGFRLPPAAANVRAALTPKVN